MISSGIICGDLEDIEGNITISERNISFMRALVHKGMQVFTYTAETHLAYRLSYMRERPAEPLITVVDYTHGGAHMFVRLLEEERAADQVWDEHIARGAEWRAHGAASHACA